MAGISDEKYEELRRILEKQNNHAYTREEAKEIGDGLVEFVTTLFSAHDRISSPDKNEVDLE